MPQEADAQTHHEYKLPIKGVNISVSKLAIADDEALKLENLIVRGGLKKRYGYVKRSSVAVNPGANKVTMLHRFYKADDSSELLAAAGNTIVKEISSAQTGVVQAFGSIVHDATSQQANAFDGDLTKTAAEGAIKTSATSFFLGKDWGATNTRLIDGFKICASSDAGFVSSINPEMTAKLQGSTDNFSGSVVDLGTASVVTDSDGLIITKLTGITVTTSFRFHRVLLTHNGASNQMNVAEVEFSETTTWDIISVGVSNNTPLRAETWGEKDSVYIAGGGTSTGLKYDGSTVAAISGLSNTPIQFLEYQDRLLVIGSGEPGALRWSDSFDDTTWLSAASTGVHPDSRLHGMVLHSLSDSVSGDSAAVLLAGSSGMYVFSGTNLTLTFSNYQIHPVAMPVGCSAPRTMVWTPIGTCFLANDLQVYILPFDSLSPIPIGENIRSKIRGAVGIESLNADDLVDATAVYQDGFYKLSIDETNVGANNTQWWLDVLSAFRISSKASTISRNTDVAWFGPMKGMRFGEMEALTGSGDAGDLVAGEDDTTVGAFVYNILKTLTGDQGATIVYRWESFFNPLSSKYLTSVCHHLEMELLNTPNVINIQFKDSGSGITASNILSLTIDTSDLAVFNTFLHGTKNYSGITEIRRLIGLSPPLNMRFISLVIHGTSTKDMEIYAVRIIEEQQNLALDVGR